MTVTAIHTRLIHPSEITLTDLIDESIADLPPDSVVVITSKVVALCEGRIVEPEDVNKTDIIEREADFFLPRSSSKYNVCLTIKHNRLLPSAGVDESNTGGHIVLWPEDPQESANIAWHHLRQKFGEMSVGVLLTDSTSAPLRLGVAGIAAAHSGFRAVNDLVGIEDLFGHPLAMTRTSIASGIAAAAVVVMGEAAEQTPIAVVTDLPFVQFQDHVPTSEELEFLSMPIEDDLYAPLLTCAPWQRGGAGI